MCSCVELDLELYFTTFNSAQLTGDLNMRPYISALIVSHPICSAGLLAVLYFMYSLANGEILIGADKLTRCNTSYE